MSKCAAYWRAKEAGKECGVPKPGKLSRIMQDLYQYGLVPDLVSMGVKEDDVYELLPYTTAYNPLKGTPSLLKLVRDSPIRKKLIDLLFVEIISGKKITCETFKKINKKYPELTTDKWEESDYIRHYGKKKRDPPNQLILKEYKPRFIQPIICRTQERELLSSLCTSGQLGILQDMNSKGYGDDEYSAFCIALKWAAEKISAQKEETDSTKT